MYFLAISLRAPHYLSPEVTT